PEAPGAPPSTLNTTLEVDVSSNTILARRWSRHPRCQC
ncbi:MAG TPA: cyclodehydratase, partial [Mycobacterium sp.]|nr:cyclodehydratase [Mycobacterium sp.]